ncbi:unnamed protein product [Rotaria sp. Silwood2]|nr:unnamed protein product [Rotaria sp. Silwood2]CAF2849632.1 unnamed protein product [Rotaria sp. Silwood2]CAF3251406.1 unnamed protein product [Rotaria sp. Silwood2]CAF4109564.1 unnamed protein product [Rotaria sp. Silwood2]CAF4177780.1 unnamed protein product [Rotaria sp. Silwood2]
MSSETIAYPINHHHHILNRTHSSMYRSTSPIDLNNKLTAIQTRKSRVALQSYYDFTDSRPLNMSNISGTTNSSNLSPQKLLERSQDLRLGRIPARPSVLSSISTANQHSLIWPTYSSPNGITQQLPTNSPTMSSTNFGLQMNKSLNYHMPDIYQRSNRTQTMTYPLLTEQQNSSMFVEPRHKSLPKIKSSVPKPYYRRVAKGKASFPISRTQPLRASYKDHLKQSKNNTNEHIVLLYESEEDDENVPIIDEEFEEYIQKSTIKCADWLIKYVFDKEFDYNDE